jgi:hypothetical protein
MIPPNDKHRLKAFDCVPRAPGRSLIHFPQLFLLPHVCPKTMNPSIPVYQADGSLYASDSPALYFPLKEARPATVTGGPVLNRLLPRQVDNTYRGYRLALWLFALVVLVKVAMSVNSIFNGHTVASSADGIPLDTFTPAGAQAVVSLFAAWGLGQLILCLLCIVVLVRYRALVPFLFAVLLLEHLSRRLIFLVMPIVRTGTPPGVFVNLALVALMVVGLTLSLWSHDSPPAA